MFGDLMNMITDDSEQDLGSRLKKRRILLSELIAQKYPEKSGSVFLFAPMELDYQPFLQESSFYYFSGISEPAHVLSFALNKPTALYQPNFGSLRDQWMDSVDVINADTKVLYGLDDLVLLGKQVSGYHIDPYFLPSDYQVIIEVLTEMVASKKTIFTLYPVHTRAYAQVKIIIDRLALFVPGLMQYIVDVSDLVIKLRRKKDMAEIEMMYHAISITQAAFQAAAHVIKPGVNEAQVHAAIEYIFIENGARPAYTPMVAGGNNATILHYNTNNATLADKDLILIDAGAMYQHYCADITRVFPISGKFSKQQKKLYEIVFETQQYVADFVRPGMWITNVKEQDISLQHIAINFLKKHGYEKYFPHGIGHFLGLDVHDVGARTTQLEAGDVITIEPGIYLPKDSVGIRIEDNYWILADSAPVCMSEDIAKSISDIEKMVQQNF